MTQNDLAEKMNVTDKAVSKWERNLSCPDVNSIPKLAETLGVSVEELLNAQAKQENSKVDNIIKKGARIYNYQPYKLQVVGDNLVQILCTRLFFFIFYKKGLGFDICSLYND